MGQLSRLRNQFLEHALAWLDRRARLREDPSAPNAMAPHLRTGLDGERAAFFYLRRKNYVVVARRWNQTALRGDLDLVAWDMGPGMADRKAVPELCFIEVKTRTSRAIATAEASVDREKRRVLRRLGWQYLRQLPSHVAYEMTGLDRPAARFDIVSVYREPGNPVEIQHFERAFGWSERRRGE